MKKLLLGILLALCMAFTLSSIAAATTPDMIDTQPQDFDITAGEDAVFYVEAIGEAAYQWYGHQILSTADLISVGSPDERWAKTGFVWQSQTSGQSSTTAELTAVFDVATGQSITFDWNVDSENNFDRLSYDLVASAGDSVADDIISGRNDAEAFERVELDELAPGLYTLTFRYTKDGSINSGQDCGWVKLYGALPLEGATASTLTIRSDSPYYHAGQSFYCVVSAGQEETRSDLAYLITQHTVSFDLNYLEAGSLPPQTVTTFAVAAEPSAPTRANYGFSGWYTHPAGTQKFSFATPVTSDVALYAGWKEIIYLRNSEDIAAMLQGFEDTPEVSLNKYYRLTQSITLPEGFTWYNDCEFTGVFDGNGCTLDGLAAETMFGTIGNTGSVKNLTLGSGCAFSLAGIADDNYGTIESCTNYGAVTSQNDDAAGIAYTNYGTIENCTNYGAVTSTSQNDDAAGIALVNSGTLAGCVNHGVISAPQYQYGVCGQNYGTITECTSDGRLVIYGYTISPLNIMAFRPVDAEVHYVDVKGIYNGTYLKTTYDHQGYESEYDGTWFEVEAKPSFINKDNFVKLEYVLTAKQAVTDAKFALHTDVQIGENDSAPISLLFDGDGKAIGLKMVDDNERNASYGAQFNLFFRDTYGVTDVDSFWFGSYYVRTNEENLYGNIAAQLGVPSAENPNGWTAGAGGEWTKTYYSGDYVYNHADGLRLVGTDSGLAVSWQGINMTAGEKRSFSVLVGIGSAAMAPPVAQSLTYDPAAGKASFTLLDSEARWENNAIDNPLTIFCSLDNGGEAEIHDYTAVKEEAADTYTYTFSLPALTEGFHILRAWAMNDAGMLSATKTCYIPLWEIPTYTVNGKITTTEPGVSAENLTVSLKRGDTLFAQTVTDAGGSYTFLEVPAGIYNIVVETPDGRTVTWQIEVSEDIGLDDYALPPGNKNTLVEVTGPDTPPVVADGLNALFETEALADNDKPDEGVTPDDLAVVAAGGSIDLVLSVERQEIPVDAAVITDELDENKTIGIYLDIAVQKIVKNATGAVLETELHSLKKPICIRLTLQSTDRGQQGYVIYRVHAGVMDTLTQTANANGEYFALDGNDIILYINRFSTYTIAYDTPRPTSSGGRSSAYYPLTAVAGEGGSISPAGSVSVARGQDKRFTITPQSGYVIKDVLVDGVSVGAVNTYTFKDVSKKHSIEAVFTRTVADQREHPFTDVNPEDWFDDAVRYVYQLGLMNGTAADRFSPGIATTRGMIVTILYRLENESKAAQNMTFADVAAGQYYTAAIAWAAENDIVLGYDELTFGPADNITREQMVAILYRYAQYQGMTAVTLEENLGGFADAGDISSYAVSAMNWAVGKELITGRAPATLAPGDTATRAEAATILMRFIESAK